MNAAQKRLAKKVLSMNSARRDKKQDLNSSLYDKRTFNELREGLADYPADKLKLALSGYITDPIYITGVTNDNGNITVNYRFLDENLNEEFVNAEIGYGLDYIENIHLFSNRQDISSGRKPMVHRLKSVNSSKMTADQAKQKYKELLTQCYISVYDHKLDVNDPQVVEYRKQMNDIKAEFGDVANTMDGYIKSLDKKYKNSIDFTSEDLDSGLFSKKEKPSEEILKMYKQLKKSIDNLIKAGTPASNSNLKNMQNKATEFEKKYDSKALKMALAASRRRLNSSAESGEWKETYHVNPDRTLASMVHYNDVTGEYDGEVVWIDENGKPQQKTYKGKYNPRLAFAPFVSYWITQDTKQTVVEESDASAYIEACSNIKDAIKNKWTSENSSRRKLNSMWQGNTYDDPMIYFTLIPNDVHDTKAVVRGGVHEYTGEYNIELIYLNDNQNRVEAREVTGTFPTDYVRYSFNRKDYDVEKDADMFDDLNNINPSKLLSYIKKVVKAELGTDAFMLCSDDAVEARALENLEETARYNRNVNSSRRGLNCMTERAFVDEVYYYINLIPDDVTTTPIVVKGAVEVATSEYDFTVYALTDDGKFKVSTLKGTFAESLTTPQIHENEAQLLKLVKDMLLQELGTDAFIECDDDKVVYAQINDLKDKAAFIKAQQDAERKRQNDIEFEREYGVKPEEWHPFNDLLNSTNSSRRRRMNSSRRRLNSAVNNTENCYFVTEDRTLAANLEYDPEGEFIIGFIRGQRADGTLVDENVTEPCRTDVPTTLMWDLIEYIAGRDDFREVSVSEFNDVLLDVNALFTDVRKSRLEKYVDYRRTLR